MTDSTADSPISPLMAFLLAALSPLMAASLADLHLARLAAQEAIAAYKIRGQDELVTVAQIVGFALTALDNLRLSMPAELSLSMKLKLRGNAGALNRAARDSTRMLEKGRVTPERLEPSLSEQAGLAGWDEPDAVSDPYAVVATATLLPPPTKTGAPPLGTPTPKTGTSKAGTPKTGTLRTGTPTSTPWPIQSGALPPGTNPAEHENRLHWARAMQTAATRLQADAAIVSPGLRKTNAMWIQALTDVASDLTTQKYATAAPGMSKANLLRTTLMASGEGFPAHLFKSAKR